MDDDMRPEDEGYTEIAVGAKRSEDYQTQSVHLTYEFGRPVGQDEVRVAEEGVRILCDELAETAIREMGNKKQAQQKAAERKSAPVPGTEPKNVKNPHQDDDNGALVAQARKPNGQGVVRYPKLSALSEDKLKARLREEIADAGEDPDLHVIYDERAGLESDGEGYQFANIRPTEDNPAYAENDRGYTIRSFYANLSSEDKLYVKKTAAYEEAQERAEQSGQSGNAGGF